MLVTHSASDLDSNENAKHDLWRNDSNKGGKTPII